MVKKLTVEQLGGMPVIEPVSFVLPTTLPCMACLHLLSDLHIGSAMVDYSLIERELERCLPEGDRILLGGDIFDCIFPLDRKRFRPEAIHPRLRGRSDMVDEAINMAEELLTPYAESIDVIGVGNHEAEALQRHHTDMVGELVRRLRVKNPSIAQAGWSAFIRYRTESRKSRKHYQEPAFIVWYHHRVSNAVYAHRVLRALQEKSASFQADLFWTGHNHMRGNTQQDRLISTPTGIRQRSVRYVMTGGYFRPYEHQSQESMVKAGRKSNYIVEAGYPPATLGGTVVNLTWDSLCPHPSRVEVVQ